jgi:putative ABC transport system permease protein
MDRVLAEREGMQKAIVTERFQIPSLMPPSYAETLKEGAARPDHPDDIRPTDYMTWAFYGGNIVKEKEQQTRDTMVFFFVMEPRKFMTMMVDEDNFSAEETRELQRGLKEMESNKRAILVGPQRLAAMNKRIGERITVYSLNYKGIDLECDIAGLLPDGRLGLSAVMNRDYLFDSLNKYEHVTGKRHPMADKAMNLFWFKTPGKQEYQRIAEQIMSSPLYQSPAVKCETASSAVATFLDGFKDMLHLTRYVVVPAALFAMTLVIAIAISIGVRERQTEMAVMKVLGFRPGHILALVLGEALLIGAVSGILSGTLTMLLVNGRGGFTFPIAFFPRFLVDSNAWWWGLAIGAGTAFAGSIRPAWTARSVKVADVFAKVA